MPVTLRSLHQALLTLILSLFLSTALVLASPGTAEGAKTPRELKIAHALDVARNQKGDPYKYGADGPNRFDCSGLTQFAYGKAGLHLPRSSDSQARFARRLKNRSNIRVGDLMFFVSGGGVYHTGIFTGHWRDGRRLILHASRPGTDVKVDKVWTHHWFAGTLRRH